MKIYDYKGAAEYTNYSVSTLHTYKSKGLIPFHITGSGAVRFTEEDLNAFLSGNSDIEERLYQNHIKNVLSKQLMTRKRRKTVNE